VKKHVWHKSPETAAKRSDTCADGLSPGQIFDLSIRNSHGDILYRWSDGQIFTQAQQDLEIVGERNDVIKLRLSQSNSGAPFPPGNYVAEGWLATHSAQTFRAAVSFEIRHLPSDLFEETVGR
jgi:hypothetical protein